MSTRAALRTTLGEDADRGGACAVCGGDWSALWVGMIEIHICRQCALEVLPRLQADAIWFPRLMLTDAEQALAHMQREFWRAIAIQALRARDRGL